MTGLGVTGFDFSCVGFFVLFVGFGFIFGLLVSWVCYCLGFFFLGGSLYSIIQAIITEFYSFSELYYSEVLQLRILLDSISFHYALLK